MAEDIHPREPESANHPLPEPEQPPVVADDGAEEAERSNALPFPVVGIGASAGGIEAFIEVFSHLPAESGMAYVLIPHLPAGYKSHLVDILSRKTPMPVNEMVQRSQPEPDHVYVLPPNMQASLRNGSFILEPRADGPLRVVDHFFRSLAADQKAHAIGVVLSGTDGDGALGLKAIKGDGGIAIVQSPDTARFPEMPRTSISLDHVDRILPPAQIATELAQLAAQFSQPA